MDKLLAWWGEIKKEKHGKACYNQWKQSSRFVLLVDGMVGKEELVVLSILS